ncbi:MAG: flagellar hook-basal body complex protein FliE [Candidatus Omnitrophota bacterium]|nr:MAG: flagellar hook-basal body complex protein FliE [Candidatus Omnitrophota bacterium]
MENFSIQPGISAGKIISTALPKKIAESAQPGFQNVLANSIDQINELNRNADKAIEQLSTGEIQDVHKVMIAVEKANLTFSTMMQVRNKLLGAYQEVMRMQF